MNELSYQQKKALLDTIGEKVVNFRDRSLRMSMTYATGQSVNKVKEKQYEILSNLTDEEREKIYDLLSETITDTIYNFFEMFEENRENMKLIIMKDEEEYNMMDVTEKMGGEMVMSTEDGWISKFSKVGRFIL